MEHGNNDVLSEPEPSVAVCDGMEPRMSADDVSFRSFSALSPPAFARAFVLVLC